MVPRLNQHDAEQGIRDALSAGDTDLAGSFVALAADRKVPIDPNLADAVKEKAAKQTTFANTAGRFVRGFWSGEPVDLASLAGTAKGDGGREALGIVVMSIFVVIVNRLVWRRLYDYAKVRFAL